MPNTLCKKVSETILVDKNNNTRTVAVVEIALDKKYESFDIMAVVKNSDLLSPNLCKIELVRFDWDRTNYGSVDTIEVSIGDVKIIKK